MTDILHKYHLTIHTPDRRKEVDEQDIEYILAYLWFDYRIQVDTSVIEPGKFGGTHFHGVARSLKKIHFKSISTMGGYRLYWKEIKHEDYARNIARYHKKTALQHQFTKDLDYGGEESSDAPSPSLEGEEPSEPFNEW